MSLHVYSQLTVDQCTQALKENLTSAQVEVIRHHVFITLGHYQMRLMLEEQAPLDLPKGFSTKISFYSTQPGESERALEDTMWEVPQLQETVRSAIRAIEGGRVYFGDGSVWKDQVLPAKG